MDVPEGYPEFYGELVDKMIEAMEEFNLNLGPFLKDRPDLVAVSLVNSFELMRLSKELGDQAPPDYRNIEQRLTGAGARLMGVPSSDEEFELLKKRYWDIVESDPERYRIFRQNGT